VSIGSADAGLIWVRDVVVGDVMVGDVMVDRSVRVEWTPALERERTSMFPRPLRRDQHTTLSAKLDARDGHAAA